MSFVFEGVEENASQRFMKRFDLTMQPCVRHSGCAWLLQAGSRLRACVNHWLKLTISGCMLDC